jgi:hypothetical protein
MKYFDIKDKISSLNVSLPSKKSFWDIGNLTALRDREDGSYYQGNFERGLLLYSLVATYRPKIVIEFGTGRGYGAICMSRSLVENNIDGVIYTIDSKGYREKQRWALDTGEGPSTKFLSIADIWPNYFPDKWLSRINILHGNSVEIMKKWGSLGIPKADFAFIDGGHDFFTVKHDFYSFLNVTNPDFTLLFDDYARKPGFGVCQLIDDEIEAVFNTELIWSDRRWYGSQFENSSKPDYGMVFIDTQNIKYSWKKIFHDKRVSKFLRAYRRQLIIANCLASVRKPIGQILRFLRIR